MNQYNPENYPPVEDEPTRENPRLVEELKAMLKEDKAWESYKGYGEEYERENAERVRDGKIKTYNYPQATLVASVRVDESGRTISGHEHNPQAQSHKDLEAVFQEYLAETSPEQRALIYEGSEASYTDRDAAIAERADAGLAMYMADKAGVEKNPGEPSDTEVADEMERQGIGRAEMVLFTTLRAMGPVLLAEGRENIDLAQLVHHQLARNGIPGFREYSEEEKVEISKDPARKEAVLADMSRRAVEYTVRELNSQLAIMGLPQFQVGNENNLSYQIEDPTRLINVAAPTGPGRLGEIGRKVSEFRDRQIFNVITKQVADGKKPFMVYGGSHAVALRPALDAYFGEAAVIQGPESGGTETQADTIETTRLLAKVGPWAEAADEISQSRVMRNFISMIMNAPNAPAEVTNISEMLRRLGQGAADFNSLTENMNSGRIQEADMKRYESMLANIQASIEPALMSIQQNLGELRMSPQYGRTASELEGQVVSQIVRARQAMTNIK